MMKTQSDSKRLPLGHVTLHYLDYGGRGPCNLILLHGGGANAHIEIGKCRREIEEKGKLEKIRFGKPKTSTLKERLCVWSG